MILLTCRVCLEMEGENFVESKENKKYTPQLENVRRALASLVYCRASRFMAIPGCELHLYVQEEKKTRSFVGKPLSVLPFLVFALWVSTLPLPS